MRDSSTVAPLVPPRLTQTIPPTANWEAIFTVALLVSLFLWVLFLVGA